jgi:hypothetical protein
MKIDGNGITLGLIGMAFGMMITVIGFNLHAHSEIAKDPTVTLKTYWEGDK